MRNNLPTLELLEKSHIFPGTYMIKVIGKTDQGFLAQAVAAVREALGEEVDPPFKMREAVGGRHMSITFQPQVQTAQQVLAIYRRLRVITGLVMLW